MSWQHLDLECAKAAEATLATLEPMTKKQRMEALARVQDAGSVLPKQGPYAMVLFLETKGKKDSAPKILEGVSGLLNTFIPDPDATSARSRVKNLSENLSKLLLARKLLLLYLTYLKYQLKAKSDDA